MRNKPSLSQPIDQATNWRFPPLDNLRLMRAKYVQHAFAPHAHDYFVLGIIEDGVQTFMHGDARHITTPGKLIIINPGEVHTGEAAGREGFAYRALYPSVALLENHLESFRSPPPSLPQFPGGTVQDIDLYRWIQRLHQQSESPDSPLALETSFVRFFVEFIRRHASFSVNLPAYNSAHQAIRQVRDYLEAHYAEPITLSDLSAQVYITPYHLARLFTKQIGVPPHKYLENVRIRHAEHLLSLGFPIADVAYATGFSGQSHLTRTFKRFIGTTPGEFVRQRKIVQDDAPLTGTQSDEISE
jgi:AraC-like DNA-binding protein